MFVSMDELNLDAALCKLRLRTKRHALGALWALAMWQIYSRLRLLYKFDTNEERPSEIINIRETGVIVRTQTW